MKRKQARLSSFLVLYLAQILVSTLYVAIFLRTFSISELDPSSTLYLGDIVTYYLKDLEFKQLIEVLILGYYNAVHAFILGQLFSRESILATLLVNGLLSNCAIYCIARDKRSSPRDHLYVWLLAQPFVLAYSVGWTKEILMFLFGSLATLAHANSWLRTIAMIGVVVSRPQWSIVLLVHLVARREKPVRLLVLLLAMTIFAPLVFLLVPSELLVADAVHRETGGEGLLSAVDAWRYEYPVASTFSFTVFIFKILASAISLPVMEVINGNPNFLSFVSLYLFATFAYLFFSRRGKEDAGLRSISNLTLISLFFVACVPYVHVRYMVPFYMIYICHAYLCRKRVESKKAGIAESSRGNATLRPI